MMSSSFDQYLRFLPLEVRNALAHEIAVRDGEVAAGPPLHLYVSDLNGNDNNDGLSAASPFKTLQRALNAMPVDLFRSVVTHVGKHGGAGYTIDDDWYRNVYKGVYIWGDGAGQPGEDGFSEALASTAATGGSTTSVVTGGGLGVNTHAGKTIQILTGAAAGDLKTINEHTDTTITPCAAFSAAIQAGDTFRIVEPEVQFAPIPFASVHAPTLSPGLASGRVSFASFSGPVQDPAGLYFVNLDFNGATYYALNPGNFFFFGTKGQLGYSFTGTRVFCGLDVGTYGSTNVDVQGPVDDELISGRRQWLGWGHNGGSAFNPFPVTDNGGEVIWMGYASLTNPGGVTSITKAQIVGGRIVSTKSTIANIAGEFSLYGLTDVGVRPVLETSSTSLAALGVDEGRARFFGSSTAVRPEIRTGSGNNGVLVEGAGSVVFFTNSLQVNVPSGNAIHARRGGAVVLKGIGAPTNVGGTPPAAFLRADTVTAASLTVGSTLKDTNNPAYIVRLS